MDYYNHRRIKIKIKYLSRLEYRTPGALNHIVNFIV
ncbi:IS3 family transposase [Exiguobacterium undae]